MSTVVDKARIAQVLTEISTLLELQGENPFKIRAYQTGARVVESFGEEELAQRIAAGTLDEVKGIGEALSQKITELHTTGRLGFHEKLRDSIPAGLVEMLEVPGLGPKKIRVLHDKLGIDTVAKLQEAAEANNVAALVGFGDKTQEKILTGIRHRASYGRRHLWVEAWAAAMPLLEGLRQLPQVRQAEACGSLRRRMETVGDVDFLVATAEPAPVVDWFVQQAGVSEVTARGETKASVRLVGGLQADLRLVPSAQYVFALHHFTGSKDHNIQMRQRALARGFSLSEWGLFPAEEKHGPSSAPGAPDAAKSVRAGSETELFGHLGLAFIPPELREGLGEIEAAAAGTLPRLVEESDIRGVFHNHTTASDGHNTLEEMTAAAGALGFDYLGIADHSKSSVQARGLDAARLAEQVVDIRRLNESRRYRTHVLAGTECDILPDGRLDFPDEVLAGLDYVVVSVHSSFRQSREEMTRRIIKAIEHPHVTMLGHLSGRLLLEREAYEVDTDRIIDAAVAHGVVIELNANAYRLDLDWRHWRKAAAKGLLCAINPDAHRTARLADFQLGVGAARKGWLTAEQVITTWPLDRMKKWLGTRRT
ncbi:MAG: DNA polymerase/3'-5' exonuclease PolX [Opitutales bacterium]